MAATCKIGDCPEPAKCRGMCHTHYNRWLKGDRGERLRRPVRKVRKKHERPEDVFWERTDVRGPDDCWEWQGYRNEARGGYGQFSIEGKARRTNRIAWFLTHGEWPSRHVCHRCDNPPCVNPGHLFLGDAAANVRDMIQKGRQPQGEKSVLAKLTEATVRAIRDEYAAGGVMQKDLARKYGVHRMTIGKIVRRERWKHI